MENGAGVKVQAAGVDSGTAGVDGSKVVDGSTVGHNVEKSKKLPRGSARVAEAFKQLRRGFNLL